MNINKLTNENLISISQLDYDSFILVTNKRIIKYNTELNEQIDLVLIDDYETNDIIKQIYDNINKKIFVITSEYYYVFSQKQDLSYEQDISQYVYQYDEIYNETTGEYETSPVNVELKDIQLFKGDTTNILILDSRNRVYNHNIETDISQIEDLNYVNQRNLQQDILMEFEENFLESQIDNNYDLYTYSINDINVYKLLIKSNDVILSKMEDLIEDDVVLDIFNKNKIVSTNKGLVVFRKNNTIICFDLNENISNYYLFNTIDLGTEVYSEPQLLELSDNYKQINVKNDFILLQRNSHMLLQLDLNELYNDSQNFISEKLLYQDKNIVDFIYYNNSIYVIYKDTITSDLLYDIYDESLTMISEGQLLISSVTQDIENIDVQFNIDGLFLITINDQSTIETKIVYNDYTNNEQNNFYLYNHNYHSSFYNIINNTGKIKEDIQKSKSNFITNNINTSLLNGIGFYEYNKLITDLQVTNFQSLYDLKGSNNNYNRFYKQQFLPKKEYIYLDFQKNEYQNDGGLINKIDKSNLFNSLDDLTFEGQYYTNDLENTTPHKFNNYLINPNSLVFGTKDLREEIINSYVLNGEIVDITYKDFQKINLLHFDIYNQNFKLNKRIKNELSIDNKIKQIDLNLVNRSKTDLFGDTVQNFNVFDYFVTTPKRPEQDNQNQVRLDLQTELENNQTYTKYYKHLEFGQNTFQEQHLDNIQFNDFGTLLYGNDQINKMINISLKYDIDKQNNVTTKYTDKKINKQMNYIYLFNFIFENNEPVKVNIFKINLYEFMLQNIYSNITNTVTKYQDYIKDILNNDDITKDFSGLDIFYKQINIDQSTDTTIEIEDNNPYFQFKLEHINNLFFKYNFVGNDQMNFSIQLFNPFSNEITKEQKINNQVQQYQRVNKNKKINSKYVKLRGGN